MASALERAGMVSRAIAPYKDYEMSMCEVERVGPTYSIDTVRKFQRENPGEEFVLILGSDAYNGIGSWKDSTQLLAIIDIVVAVRPGFKVQEIPGAHTLVLESEMFDISSTDIRAAAKTGADLSQFVSQEIIRDVKRIYGA